ncbi:MAG TPA: DUF5683 domain-containing protein, partial [Flavisolibacter sp.]|nr:DUF5683 domain-containing protein [Flavisolibacter sp.]
MSKNTTYKLQFVLLSLFLLQASTGFCQVDSTKNPVIFDSTKPRILVDSLPKVDSPVVRNKNKVDSVMLHHSPKKAAIRSALIPGWGQFYNKKYWKIPIVYGALGVSAGVFVFNLQNYKDLRFAYKAKYNATLGDSSNLPFIKPELVPLDINALRSYRDYYRRNIDYSAIVFILLWGLNVVDATV